MMLPPRLFIILISLSNCIIGLNISRLMSLYIDACGEKHMCYDWPDLTYYTPHPALSRCPPCFCDDSCFRNLNCCPDKFFQRPLAVLDSPLLFISDFEKNNDKIYLMNYEIISTCLDSSEKEDKEKCEDPKDNFHFERPVTSLATNFTYRNIFCALCHGEKNEGDLIFWDIALKETDVNFINFIESNKQLQFFSKVFQITLIFTPPFILNGIVKPHQVLIDGDFTDPCTDDRDLQIACSSSYHNRFRLYQNIFCYMCLMNSIDKGNSIIDTCANPNNKITQKCLQRPKSSMTYPHKNFYCYQCNVPLQNEITNDDDKFNSEERWYDYHFVELSFNITERFKGQDINQFYLKVQNMHFKTGNLLHFIRETATDSTTFQNVEKVDERNWEGMLKSFSTVYPNHICRQDLLPEGLQRERQCDCSSSCLFVGKCTCCVDTAIMHKIECIDVALQSYGTEQNGKNVKLAVISNCFEKMSFSNEYEKIRHLCEANPSHYEIPIFSDKVTYKNIFCFLCNTNFTIENDILKHNHFEALEFTVVCNNQLRFVYAVNLGQFMELAKAQGCRIVYDTSNSILCDSEDTTTFESQCPNLSASNPLKWLCENTSSNSFVSTDKYKNEFCQICNLNETLEKLSNICLTTNGGICSSMTNQSTHLTFPCINCVHDERTQLYRDLTVHDCEPITGIKLYFPSSLMRDLFSPSRIIKDWFPTERTFQSTGDFCYPGKILKKGRCVPVIAKPNRIEYALFIFVQLSITSNSNGTTQSLLLVKDSVHQELKGMFNHHGVALKDFYFLPKRPSLEEFKNDMFHFSVNVELYFHVSYTSYFNREEIERKLLQLPFTMSLRGFINNDTNNSYESKGIRFSNLSQMLLSEDCIFREEMTKFRLFKNDIVEHNPPLLVYVSPLLLCRQKKMLQSEVIIDLINFRIISRKTNEMFHIGDFVFDLELVFRVCSYESQFVIDSVDMTNVLETITTILNIISIVSMVALLIVYMVVPGLRTLPGLNIMSTTFSLLCMQITYTIANVMEKSTLFCTITGILLHYFWLALCCCLFTCSLHMCRSFSGQRGNMHRHTNIKTIFGRYVIICYTAPFFIIITNIILTYYIQNKIGYGTALCFVEDFVQNIATFIAPLLITCVVNIVMFTITAINIKYVKHIKKSKEDKSEVVIFLKLFSLTGIVWVFQILDGILNVSVFSFVVIILTSSQGTIIFLSFASSSRILNYFRSKTDFKRKGVIIDGKQIKSNVSDTSQQHHTKSSTLHDSTITV